jgi:hypothetical protein
LPSDLTLGIFVATVAIWPGQRLLPEIARKMFSEFVSVDAGREVSRMLRSGIIATGIRLGELLKTL